MFNILLVGALSDAKFHSKIDPLLSNSMISKSYIIRFNKSYKDNTNKIKEFCFQTFLKKKKSLVFRLLHDLLSTIVLGFYVLFGRIDFVVGVYLYPHGLIAIFLAKLRNKPCLLLLPGSDLKRLANKKSYLWLINRADYFGVRGNNSRKVLESLGIDNSRIYISHNVLDDSFIIDRGQELKKEYDVIYTGFLRKPKRLEIFLEVIRRIKLTIPLVQGIIVGSGEDMSRLEKLVIEYNLQENITFSGYTDKIENYLLKSKIFLLTSSSEGLPMSIIEAMAAGLPIVTSDINDISDVVENGVNGYLINPDDINSYYEKVLDLLENDSKADIFGKNSKTIILNQFQKNYSFNAVYQKWDSLLRELLM